VQVLRDQPRGAQDAHANRAADDDREPEAEPSRRRSWPTENGRPRSRLTTPARSRLHCPYASPPGALRQTSDSTEGPCRWQLRLARVRRASAIAVGPLPLDGALLRVAVALPVQRRSCAWHSRPCRLTAAPPEPSAPAVVSTCEWEGCDAFNRGLSKRYPNGTAALIDFSLTVGRECSAPGAERGGEDDADVDPRTVTKPSPGGFSGRGGTGWPSRWRCGGSSASCRRTSGFTSG